jgi:hypothetical protein
MFSALERMYPGEIDLDVGYHLVRALTDFSDAELDPDPLMLDGATWADAKRSAARLAADLDAYLADARRSGRMR